MRWTVAGVVLAIVGVAGCQSQPEPGPAAHTSASSAPASLSPTALPGGLAMTCRGTGSPTVVLVPGLGADQSAFSTLAAALPASSRVCTTERAGVGNSPPLPADVPDPSAGAAADQLLAALEGRGMDGPYVLLGWSYGGMVVQAFTARHPDRVAGVVLEDSSVPEQFTEALWRRQHIDWSEGGRPVDQRATTAELKGIDFGDLPLFVLTEGDPTGAFRRNWFGHQDDLAALSPNHVHVVADSGHAIHEEALPLVVASVEEVLRVVDGSGLLEPCDQRFRSLAGRCA